ncbi:MAG: ATP-binding protein [Candidatus Hadarchaeota archaeon]
MNVEDIKRVVLDQREELEEIFRREKIVDRTVPTEKLLKALAHPNILAILGVRRCGKSVLSHLLLKGKRYGYVNFDDERLANMATEDLDRVLQAFYEIEKDLDYLVLDEIQDVPKWELFANRLRRTKKVVITGSNAKLLSGELATHLTGRYLDFILYPFSFEEFLRVKGGEVGRDATYSTKKTAEIKSALRDYMHTGGFPEACKFGKGAINKVYEDIITKDILLRHGVRKERDFKDLARYLISNFSKEVTFSKLKNLFGIRNVHTAKNYVDYLVTSYLVFTVERFSFKLKRQMIAPKKVYCVDIGILDVMASRFSEDTGKLMENLVFLELLRKKSFIEKPREIFYWKDHQQREVDFVVKDGMNVKQLIQVAYASGRDEIEKREMDALVKASDELRCNGLLVVTWDYGGELKLKNKKITCMPLWKWLLGDGWGGPS